MCTKPKGEIHVPKKINLKIKVLLTSKCTSKSFIYVFPGHVGNGTNAGYHGVMFRYHVMCRSFDCNRVGSKVCAGNCVPRGDDGKVSV